MTNVQETIPDALEGEVAAALTWFNANEDERFEVTGILDPEAALGSAGPRDLRLVLCGGDRCEQRSFRVDGRPGAWDVTLLDEAPAPDDAAPAPELDPPPGARRGWLDRELARHPFVLLVFYRGFW